MYIIVLCYCIYLHLLLYLFSCEESVVILIVVLGFHSLLFALFHPHLFSPQDFKICSKVLFDCMQCFKELHETTSDFYSFIHVRFSCRVSRYVVCFSPIMHSFKKLFGKSTEDLAVFMQFHPRLFSLQGFETRGTVLSDRMHSFEELLDKTTTDFSLSHKYTVHSVSSALQQTSSRLNKTKTKTKTKPNYENALDDDKDEYEDGSYTGSGHMAIDNFFCDMPSNYFDITLCKNVLHSYGCMLIRF